MLLKRGIGPVFLWLCLALIFCAPAMEAAEPHYEIVINIPAFSLHLYADGILFKTYPIGVGSTVNPSQLGTTRIINNVKFPSYYPPDWYRKGLRPIPPGPDNPVGTRWLGLGFPGYGIHGTNNPASIGTAASAGCIRMYNHDVEELASFVKVGTRVTFVYETVHVSKDVLTGRPSLLIHRDIYNQGTNTLSRTMRVLNQSGVEAASVDPDTLEIILREAAGEPRPIPRSIPLFLNDNRVGVHAVDYGGRVLLPVAQVAALTNISTDIVRDDDADFILKVAGRTVEHVTWLGNEPFMPVNEAAKALGLLVRPTDDDTVHLQMVRAVNRLGEELPIRTFVMNSWLLLPVDELTRLFNVPVRWDPASGALRIRDKVLFGIEMVDGKPYFAHDRLSEHLALDIQWKPDLTVATVVSNRF